MTRKVSKALLASLADHDAMTAFWATTTENVDGTPLTDDLRLGILIGLNHMMEAVLHKHGCYAGFRYVKHVRPTSPVPTEDLVNGYQLLFSMASEHTVLREAVRQYFRYQ